MRLNLDAENFREIVVDFNAIYFSFLYQRIRTLIQSNFELSSNDQKSNTN